MTDAKTPSPSDALPCPFCGHSGPLEFQDGSTHRWGVAYCANCGASSGETRRDYPDTGAWHLDAVAQWNTRAQPAPVREPFTQAQRKRLYQNRELASTKLVGTDLTEAEWHRIVQYIEAAHGITANSGKGDGNADT